MSGGLMGFGYLWYYCIYNIKSDVDVSEKPF